ncbi:MAG: hypothetical protein Q7U80_00395 [Thiobacillus sp.]|nr:hypothetical protein [Thiobacillus sp.]MDP3126288.1 hypothetical protein [Thiobacillus sp.]
MPEWKDLLAALASLIATFAGAWAAFRFESKRRNREEEEKRIGAANHAIYVIYHYWNILEQFRKEVLEPHRGQVGAWLNLAAHPAAPVATDRFHPAELQFLLQEGQPDAYVTLMLEEQRFLLAMNLIQEHSRIVLGEVFPRMARAGIAVGQALPQAHVEEVLGVDVTHKLKQITTAIYKNVDEDLPSLIAAHEKLRSTMKALFPKKKFLQVVFESDGNAV